MPYVALKEINTEAGKLSHILRHPTAVISV
jgi:hypothetical protein